MAFSPIVIADGSSTPVNVTFQPIRRTDLKAFYQEDNATLVDAGRSLSVGITRATGKGTRHRATVSLKAPITQTVDGVTTVIDSDYVDISFNFARISTNTSRQSLEGLAGNGLLIAAVKDAINKLIPIG